MSETREQVVTRLSDKYNATNANYTSQDVASEAYDAGAKAERERAERWRAVAGNLREAARQGGWPACDADDIEICRECREFWVPATEAYDKLREAERTEALHVAGDSPTDFWSDLLDRFTDAARAKIPAGATLHDYEIEPGEMVFREETQSWVVNYRLVPRGAMGGKWQHEAERIERADSKGGES